MSELTQCELKRLGKDIDTHEKLRVAIDKSFKSSIAMGCPISMMTETKELFTELVILRGLHNIPSDGNCPNCSGDKCPKSQSVDVVGV